MARQWPSRDALEAMDTLQLGCLANALGVGRWVIDEPRAMIIDYLWSKIAVKEKES